MMGSVFDAAHVRAWCTALLNYGLTRIARCMRNVNVIFGNHVLIDPQETANYDKAIA